MSKLKLRTKPFGHQREACARALKQGSHAFFFEPRCGKSKAALDALAIQHHRGEVDRAVVIAPLTVLSVWEDQIRAHMSVPAKIKMTGERPWTWYPRSYHDGPRDRAILQLYLINYDKFSRRGEDEAYSNDWLKSVQSWRPDLLILDESHRVKSAGAVRSQALWRMVQRLRQGHPQGKPWVYLLTGTPNPKGYQDLFSQFRIMDQGIFGTSKAGFDDEYCMYGFGKRKYTVIGYRNKKQLLKKVKARASIISAEEAGLAGQEFFNPIRVKLPPDARRMYDELANTFVTELEDGATITAANAGVLRLRLLQLTGGYTTAGEQIHQAKLDAARDFLSDLCDQGENVVVYARFIPEVAALTEAARRVGYEVRTIRGGVKRKDRATYLAWYGSAADRNASKPRCLVFQAEAGSLGLDLTAAAETFFFGLPDSWETYFQCLNRVKGPKQKRPVRHSFLITQNTVDSSVLASLRNKRDLHREMMNNPKSFLFGL